MRPLLLAAALTATGCWSENKQLGDDELFRVHSKTGALAQFVKGPLPGTPPPTGVTKPPTEASPDGGPAPEVVPKLVEFQGPGAPIQGSGDVVYTGSATKPTASYALFLERVSTGYWVLPVDDFDVNTDTYGIEAHLDFDRAIPSDKYRMITVGIDDANRSGPQIVMTSLCIASAVPDGYSGCKRVAKGVPEAVISITWDANVDLDLQVRTPDGDFIDPKHPTEFPPTEAGTVPPGSAVIDRDSNAGCATDGNRTENLVWSDGNPPKPGRYTVYANLFDACKQPSVRFTVSAYHKEVTTSDAGDSARLVPLGDHTASGELLDFQANGGTARGLFVTTVRF